MIRATRLTAAIGVFLTTMSVGLGVGAGTASAAVDAEFCLRVTAEDMNLFKYSSGSTTVYPHKIYRGKKLWVLADQNGRFAVDVYAADAWRRGWVNNDPRWTERIAC